MEHERDVPYHGTLRGYMTGFALALVLTAIPFGLVAYGSLPRATLLFWILLAAVAQIGVHLHYFLHLDTSSAERWNVMTLLFTGLIMFLFLAGSLWIMYNMRVRMVEAGPHQAAVAMLAPISAGDPAGKRVSALSPPAPPPRGGRGARQRG